MAQGAQVAMWSPLTGPDGAIMTELANRFNEENTQGIQVQHVAQPEYLQKLTTAAAGNTLPELTVIRASDTAEMAARNVIKPLGDEALNILGGANLAAEFPEQIWNSGAYNGEHYAIPLDVHPLVLYYNKDMFQQAGITMPTDRPMTRQEFEAAADALNKDGVAGIAIGTLDVVFETILEQFGGSVVNEDGTQATFNSEEGVEALTYVQQLRQKHSPNTGGEGDPEITLFRQGRAAMVIHGPWQIPNLTQLPSTGVTMVPQLGDTVAVWGNSHQLALTTDDPARQAAAACWIGWLSENSALWATAGMIPARESVRTSAELTTVAPVMANFAEEAEYAVLLPSVPGIGSAIRAEGYVRAVNAVLLSQQTDVKAALDQAAQRSNELLEQNRRTYGGSQ
jgi:multiple sugar transport system substrate-binding protein